MTRDQGQIHPLTSVRFFAAALVVVTHMSMIPGLEWMATPKHVIGRAGVSVFFVLSGYIITYSYWQRDWKADFWKNTGDFYWNRFARIYPLHWLVFLIALPLGLNSNTARVSVSDLPWLFSLTDMLWPGFQAGPPPAKVAWTLSCEVLFYLLSPLLILLMHGKRNPFATAAAMLVIYTPLIVVLSHAFPHLNWTAYQRVPEFLLGIVGFHLLRRLNTGHYCWAFLAGGTVALAGACVGNALFNWKFYFFAYAPGSLLIILGCATVSGRTSQFLSRPNLVLLGHSSYGLYLLHDPILRYCRVFCTQSGIVFAPAWSVLAGLVLFLAIVLASVLCFKFYETPARLRLRALVKRRSSLPAVVPIVEETIVLKD